MFRDAELEADLEAEEELADAGGDMVMADGMNPPGDVNSPAAAPAVEAACIISQADGAKIYSNPSAKEAACQTTCDAFAATVPDRECSFGDNAVCRKASGFEGWHFGLCLITDK